MREKLNLSLGWKMGHQGGHREVKFELCFEEESGMQKHAKTCKCESCFEVNCNAFCALLFSCYGIVKDSGKKGEGKYQLKSQAVS